MVRDPTTEKTNAGILFKMNAGVPFSAILPHTGTTFLPQKFKNSGKISLLKYLLCYEPNHFSTPIKVRSLDHACHLLDTHCYCDGRPFIANLPHTGKQYDCIILSKTDRIDSIANINPNHHNCARPALRQALLITENIKSICHPQQPFLGRSNESCHTQTSNMIA